MSGRKWRKKRFFKCFIGVVLVGLMLCACGSNEEGTVVEDSEAVSSVTEEQTEADTKVTDESTGTAVEDSETGGKAEETEEESETTEMIDWETFAAQEDTDEICLVVYNEMNKTQKILGLDEKEKDPIGGAYIYQIQEGDKFAVPIRDNIVKIWINDEEKKFESDDAYFEVEIPEGDICQVYVITYGAQESKHFVLQK